MTNKLFFVTGNKSKFLTAKKYFEDVGIEISQVDLDINEGRSPSVEQVAIEKAKQAFEKIKKPLIVEDSGFVINSLKNFPGTYIKFILSTISIQGILKLIDNNRECYFRSVIAYSDENGNIITFILDEPGRIALKPSENEKINAWSDLWKIYIPEGFDKPLNDLNDEEYEKFNKVYDNISNFKKLSVFLKEKHFIN